MKLDEYIICSGFGGQGVMSMGQLLAYSGMLEEKHVSWLPSYGAEMRGGTANCSTIISENLIGSPIVHDNATTVIVMNLPSLRKFENSLVVNGNLLINSSLINEKTNRSDINAYYIPANALASSGCENIKVANMVMLGAYLELCAFLKKESILEAFLKVFGERKSKLLPINKKALELGSNYIIENY